MFDSHFLHVLFVLLKPKWRSYSLSVSNLRSRSRSVPSVMPLLRNVTVESHVVEDVWIQSLLASILLDYLSVLSLLPLYCWMLVDNFRTVLMISEGRGYKHASFKGTVLQHVIFSCIRQIKHHVHSNILCQKLLRYICEELVFVDDEIKPYIGVSTKQSMKFYFVKFTWITFRTNPKFSIKFFTIHVLKNGE